MTKNSKKNPCPYFSQKQGGACMVIKGGLYLPLQEHIVTYCNTAEFSACHQYNAPSVGRGVQHEIDADPATRRRFRRVKSSMPVTIYTCDEKGTPVAALDDSALTLDIGMGGMKISSQREIRPNMMLAFRFADDYIPSTVTGVGEVRWTRHLPESASFQAGISFTDSSLPSAIGSRFALS